MKKFFICMLFLAGCSSNQNLNSSISYDVAMPSPPPFTNASISIDTFKVRNLDLTKANVTYLLQEVNNESVNSIISDINRFNSLNNEPIYLILDTPGGSVGDGARLISAMQASRNVVVAVDIGMAASMGFMILEHASTRMAVSRSILMAHPASISVEFSGELDKAVSRFSFLKRYVDKMDMFVATRAGLTYEDFKLKSNREFWLDAQDALNQHFLDEIVAVKLPNKSFFGLGDNKLRKQIQME